MVELKKKKTVCENVFFYVSGGTNESVCINGDCSGGSGSGSGSGSGNPTARPMGGNTVCFN